MCKPEPESKTNSDVSAFSVTFNKNNNDYGSTEASPPIKVVITPKTTVGALPAAPKRSGWTFNGWNTKADGAGTAFTAKTAVTGDIEVYAQWTANTYTITFNGDGATVNASPSSMIVTTPAANAGTLPTPPEKTGCFFGGWYTEKNGSGTAFTATTTIKASITVYAKWIEGIISSSGIEMVKISAGAFSMGSDDTLSFGTQPVHQVILTSGFYMGKYQVTQDLWKTVMTGNTNSINDEPGYFKNSPAAGETQGKRPVEQVNWYDVLVFCNRLSEMEGLTPAYSISGSTNTAAWGSVPTGSNITLDSAVIVTWDSAVIVNGSNGYRLATEAQWEYACRAGTTTAYNTGSSISESTGWYIDYSEKKTHEVGIKPANTWGLYDMHGNVWEWCWDWYGDYTSGTQTDPAGASSGPGRILRGGSWYNYPEKIRSASRDYFNPITRFYGFGLRLVRPAQ